MPENCLLHKRKVSQMITLLMRFFFLRVKLMTSVNEGQKESRDFSERLQMSRINLHSFRHFVKLLT